MTRIQLEENLRRNVKIRLFDGEVIEGRLRKTGEDDFKNDPNLYIPQNMYFLTDELNTCRTCLFKVSHIQNFKTLNVKFKVAKIR